MKGLSIIVPVYNEEKSIESTFKIIYNTLKILDINYEIIAIDDGSQDGSFDLLSNYSFIKIERHKLNKGYGASIKTGLRKAKYDSICITDADGTYPNDKIGDLYNIYINDELDMIVASRTGKNVSYPFIKKIPKYFIIKLANYITNSDIPDINSGLRIFNKELALKYFHLYPNGFSFTTTITMSLLCSEYKVDYQPIDYFSRVGDSKIKPIKDTIGFFKLLLKMSMYFRPFKFFTPVIIVFALISIAVLIRDIFYLNDLTQSGIFFPVFTFLFFSIGLIADMIIKRTS
jgi:glycosyltransferase involved in cell wall biosynthesis